MRVGSAGVGSDGVMFVFFCGIGGGSFCVFLWDWRREFLSVFVGFRGSFCAYLCSLGGFLFAAGHNKRRAA